MTNRESYCQPCTPAYYQSFLAEDDAKLLSIPYIKLRIGDWEFIEDEVSIQCNSSDDESYEGIETRSIEEIEKELAFLVSRMPDTWSNRATVIAHCKEGYNSFNLGDYDKAIECYNQAANEQMNDDIAFSLAFCYYIKGQYQKAITAANRCHENTYYSYKDTTKIDRLYYLIEQSMKN